MRFIVSLCLVLISVMLHSQSQPKSAEAILEEGITLQEEGDYAGAIALFNKCIYLYPTQAEAYAFRAACKEQLHQLSSALTDYTISLELLPNQYEVLLKRGALLFRLELYEKSREDFLKLLTLPTGETTTVFYRKSAYSEGTDKIMTAQGFLKPQVFNYLCLIETQLNQCKKGVAYADSAIALNPIEADYYVNRALAKQACQDRTFKADFNRALDLNPNIRSPYTTSPYWKPTMDHMNKLRNV
jgi:tetratricopeptide (TPR) repeat protein